MSSGGRKKAREYVGPEMFVDYVGQVVEVKLEPAVWAQLKVDAVDITPWPLIEGKPGAYEINIKVTPAFGVMRCPACVPARIDRDHGNVLRHQDGSFCGHSSGEPLA